MLLIGVVSGLPLVATIGPIVLNDAQESKPFTAAGPKRALIVPSRPLSRRRHPPWLPSRYRAGWSPRSEGHAVPGLV